MFELPPNVERQLSELPADQWDALCSRVRPPEQHPDPKVRAAAALKSLRTGMSVEVVDALKKALAGNNADDSADETGSAAPADDTDPRAAAAQALRELRAGSPNATRTAVAGITLPGAAKYDRPNAEAVIRQHFPLDQTD